MSISVPSVFAMPEAVATAQVIMADLRLPSKKDASEEDSTDNNTFQDNSEPVARSVEDEMIAVAVLPKDNDAWGECTKPQCDKPHLVCVTVCKPFRNARIGIMMKKDATWPESDRALRVMDIPESSLLRGTPISVGDEIVSINGIDCRGCKTSFACDVIRQATSIVTIVTCNRERRDADTVLTHVVKRRPDMSLGIGLVSRWGEIRVNRLDPDGLIGEHSLLSEGDKIVSINGVSCLNDSLSLMEAIALLRTSQRSVSICTERRIENHLRPHLICATVLKDASKKKLDFSINMADDKLRVGFVKPDGLLAHTPISTNDRVLSINNVDCQRCKDMESFDAFVRKLTGEITVVVKVDGGNPCVTATTITKPHPASLVGVVLSQRDGCVVVRRVLESGLLMNSLLNVGDRVLSINGHDCTMMTVGEATELIRCAEKTVTILAMTKSDVAIVVSASTTAKATTFDGDVANYYGKSKHQKQ